MICSTSCTAGKWKLSREHTYYYQVQAQLNICGVQYGDFVVWSKEEVIIERIYLDRSFFEDLMSRVENFFMHSVLPELIGKWLTRKPISDEKGVVRKQLQIPASEARKSMVVEEDPEALWCYCGEPSHGEMIMCDHKTCKIKWFHFNCLKLHCAPKGKWYCPSCRKLKKYKN